MELESNLTSIKRRKVYEYLNQDSEFVKLSKEEQEIIIEKKVHSMKEAFFISFENENITHHPVIIVAPDCFGLRTAMRILLNKRIKKLLKNPEFAKLSEKDQYYNALVLCND